MYIKHIHNMQAHHKVFVVHHFDLCSEAIFGNLNEIVFIGAVL